MNYKMIVLDLDGTLLDDNKSITPKNKQVLNTLYKKGIKIVIATGRTFMAAKYLVKDLGFDVIIFSNNGNLVRHSSNNNKIFHRYIDSNLFYQLLGDAKKADLYPILHVDHFEENIDVLFEKNKIDNYYNSYTLNPKARYKVIDSFYHYKNPRILLMLFLGSLDSLKSFQAKISIKYNDKFKSHIITSLTKIGPVLEIMSPYGSKWNSIKEYARTINITPDEIIAIGDDNNDLEMIVNAGLGIAMKNATKPLLSSAKKISAYTNNQDGVAHVLKEIYF
ncbi:MAG: Cof-type HAD-IIB family hydrolase [Clostridia bacterium]|nr:Cof-type HAD-IIB family hydrolase [Clostridia bacterium]